MIKADFHKVRVLISRDFPVSGISMLRDAGFSVTEWPHDRPMLPKELTEGCQGHQALFCASSDRLDRDFLEACSHLDIISQFSAGYDNIDLDTATNLGIAFANAPGAMKNATADVAFGLMIMVSRKMIFSHKRIERGDWKFFRPQAHLGMELNGKTLGIFGMGQIGLEMAKKSKGAFDMDIIYYSRSQNQTAERELSARRVSFEELLAQSDVLSVHSSLSPETRRLFDQNAFSKMKDTAIFINTARGPIHHETDLIKALEECEIWGAGLDVTDPEPMAVDNPLLQMENVAVLPHIGSSTIEARTRMSEMAAQNIIDFYTTGEVKNLVNREVGRREA